MKRIELMTKNSSRTRKENFSNSESGAIIVFLAVALVALVAMAALAVDQGKGLMNHREAENLADQIALATVKGLDGTQPGWSNSEAFARDIISKVDINTVDMAAVRTAAQGNISNVDTPDLNITIQWGFFGHTNGYDEQGVFTPFADPTTRNQQTFRLPAHFLANSVRVVVTVKDVQMPFQSALNSVLGVAGLDTFERVVGIATAVRDEGIEQAVAPIAIPACHFFTEFNGGTNNIYDPDTFNVSDSNTYASQMARMSTREIVARDAVGLDRGYDVGSPEFKKRVDGNLRSDSYPLSPLWNFSGGTNFCYEARTDGTNIQGWQPNCKAPPINAVLGLPAVSGGNQASAGNAVAYAFEAGVGDPIRQGRIGAGFQPILESGDQGQSFLNATMATAVGRAISGGNSTIERAFIDGSAQPGQHVAGPDDNSSLPPVDPQSYRANFPKRKNIRSGSGFYQDPLGELRVVFMDVNPDPTQHAIGPVFDPMTNQIVQGIIRAPLQMGIAMGNTADYIHVQGGNVTNRHQHPGNGSRRFTNPMCHTETGGDIVADNYNSKVLVANAMLIASAEHDYCDWGAQMSNNYSARALPPDVVTDPVVVGFVPINIFDYRLTEMQEPQPPTINYPGPWDDTVHGPVLWNTTAADIGNSKDINNWGLDLAYSMPAFFDLLNRVSNFGHQLDSVDYCNSCTNISPTPPNCTGVTTPPACPAQIDASFQDVVDALAGFTEPVCPPGPGGPNDEVACIDDPYQIPEWVDICFGEIGTALEEAAEEAALENAWSCYEICGGIHVPVGWETNPDFAPTFDALTAAGLIGDPLLTNSAPGAVSEDGLTYNWIGFDANCVDRVSNDHGSSASGALSGINCVHQGDAVSRQPRGTWNCPDICAGSREKSGRSVCGGIFGSCRRSYSATCTNECEIANGISQQLGEQNENNFADNVNADEAAYDLTPPPPPNGGPSTPVLAVAENLDNQSGPTQVCLPRLRNDASNFLSNAAWEPPWPREPGYGCGGVRLRLTHEPVSLMFGKRFDQLRPSLAGK